MKIKEAAFVISNTDYKLCPSDNKPEFAFIGRSNVGKSSLINMLVGNKNLAKTSGKPGKTQLINHFVINNEWYLVDLPGYGYAKASKVQREKWEKFIAEYLTKRDPLLNVFVLLDSRLEPQKIDLEFITYLGETEVPFCIVFTKADKISKVKIDSHVAAYKKKMFANNWAQMPHYFVTSATEMTGKMELLEYIDEVNQEVFKNNSEF